MSKVYGIDLGTTYSCIACIDEYGQPMVIPNEYGEQTTPSVVYFSANGKNSTVGKIAKNSQVLDYRDTVSFIKREMGKDYKSPTDFPGGLTPTEISAVILRKLVDYANDATDGTPSRDVVITCPAYFGTTAREQTKQAGQLAGLNVLRIINEPTAAAVAYGAYLNNLKDGNSGAEKLVLIYDLGGGTFDISFIRACGNDVEVIVTGGDSHLGGYDWDLCLAEEMLKKFNKQFKTKYSFENDKALLNDFLMKAEDVKKALTSRAKTHKPAAIFSAGKDGKTLNEEVTLESFDKITEHLLEKTIALVQNVLQTAEQEKGVKLSDKVEVLLVGGSSRMPQVARRLQEFFRKYHCRIRLRDPDECVAKGAAIIANSELNLDLCGDDNNEPVELYDVTSKTYGEGCRDINSEKDLIQNLIFHNTPLPVEAVGKFFTSIENQTSIPISVFESDSDERQIDAGEGVSLDADHYLEGLPSGLPKGTDILVKYAINREGILTVTATCEGIQIEFPVKVKGVMTPQEINKRKVLIAKMNIE